jgi:hypothetical protein
VLAVARGTADGVLRPAAVADGLADGAPAELDDPASGFGVGSLLLHPVTAPSTRPEEPRRRVRRATMA